jgi:gamma-glutamylcyclotransferase (GGCT)/AIG2-like uncharacterized protein YtfP
MEPNRLIKRIGKYQYHTASLAMLCGYKFIYNKKSTVDEFARSNLEEDKDSKVCGVCYEIDSDDLDRLDKYEGGYCREIKDIKLIDSGEKIKAAVYISSCIDNSLLPSDDYKNIIIKGAKFWNFEEAYILKYLDC